MAQNILALAMSNGQFSILFFGQNSILFFGQKTIHFLNSFGQFSIWIEFYPNFGQFSILFLDRILSCFLDRKLSVFLDSFLSGQNSILILGQFSILFLDRLEKPSWMEIHSILPTFPIQVGRLYQGVESEFCRKNIKIHRCLLSVRTLFFLATNDMAITQPFSISG